MRVPALYYEDGSPDSEPVFVHVRAHEKFGAIGQLPGGQDGYAERRDYIEPRLIFDREEREPARHAVVCLSEGVAYEIHATDPPDGFTTTAFVTRVSESKAVQFDHPEVDIGPDGEEYVVIVPAEARMTED